MSACDPKTSAFGCAAHVVFGIRQIWTLVQLASEPACDYRPNAMTNKAEQYRHSGHEALVSAEKANSKSERAQLLEIAETWFKLAEEKRERESPPLAKAR